MPRSYNPQYTFDLNDLKKRILSNAHAYYAHRFSEAQRCDFITSSILQTDRRDSMEYRGALIVCPDPKSNTWAMLYKSHFWPAVEDTVFKINSWLEEKMSAVFDKIDDGEKWAAAKKKSQNGVSDNERKSTVDEDKMADVQTTKGSPRSQDTTADHVGNGTDIGDKTKTKRLQSSQRTPPLVTRLKPQATLPCRFANASQPSRKMRAVRRAERTMRRSASLLARKMTRLPETKRRPLRSPSLFRAS